MNVQDGFSYFLAFTKQQFCYHRNKLTEEERKVYDQIRKGFLSYAKRIPFSGVSVQQMEDAIDKVLLDNPYLCYIESTSSQYFSAVSSGLIHPVYRFTREKTNEILLSLIQKATAITAPCQGKSDLEKERIIHDFFCHSVTYDHALAPMSFECAGPLLSGQGVCEGISKAAKLLFDFVRIRSLLVVGRLSPAGQPPTTAELHGWNMVQIQGQTYHLDITSDMQMQSYGVTRYDYFNLSDGEIQQDHTIHTAPLPASKQGYGYYKRNQMYMHTQSQFQGYLIQQLNQRKKDILFQLPYTPQFQSTKAKLLSLTSKICHRPPFFLHAYTLESNEGQFVFHLHLD